MSKNNEWWKPDNLVKTEDEYRQISDTRLLDTRNDFGSYRKVLLSGSTKGSLLGFHNDLRPMRKIKAINNLIKDTSPKTILDAGCGMGFTTAALSQFYKGSKVLGVDVSKDAISFASRHHKNADFISMVITPDSEKLGLFDLIFCFEFYPFTRNIDHDLQSRFIQYFSSQLTCNGKIIIYQLWENPESLSSIIDLLVEKLPKFTFSLYTIPNPRLTQYLPNVIARWMDSLVGILLNRKFSKTVLIITPRVAQK